MAILHAVLLFLASERASADMLSRFQRPQTGLFQKDFSK